MRHDLARFKQRLVALERKMAQTGGMVLTEAQVAALERKREDDIACPHVCARRCSARSRHPSRAAAPPVIRRTAAHGR
jgi:hypothetical protein